MRALPLRLHMERERAAPDLRSVLWWGPWLVLTALTAGFAVLFSGLSLRRHAAFQSHAFDLGNMDQAAWNTMHGQFLRFTDMSVGHDVLTTRLAIHVEPLLAALSPLYLVHNSPETLLAVQAVVVATGAVPAYLLGRSVLGYHWLSLVFPVGYLLHPSLQNAVLDDFHAVSMTSCFLLWVIYSLQRHAMGHFVAWALLAMSTKEEIGLLIAMMGVWLLLRRHLYTGFLSIAGGAGWFFVCVLIIIPAFNPAGHSPYLARYSYLGHGLGGITLAVVHHPDLLLRTLTSESRLLYLTHLFHPLGYVSVLGLPVVLLALPGLAINMLSADSHMWSGFYQYSSEIVPFALAGAVWGSRWASVLARRFKTVREAWVVPALCGFVLVATLADTWKFGFTPLASGYIIPSPGSHQQIEQRALEAIPSRATVAAADEIVPHLAHRHWIYLLPTSHPRNGPPAQYIALDASIPSSPVEPHTIHAEAVRLLRHGYGIVSAKDGILVLRRGVRRGSLPKGFYTFMSGSTSGLTRVGARWGGLQLVGVIVHPRSGTVNRSRPAVAVESFWRVRGRIPSGARIAFYLSPVYSGSHAKFSATWVAELDSPTWDWLPLTRWPAGHVVRANSLGLVPEAGQTGKVDVAIGVSGLGRLTGGGTRISHAHVRIATISVDGS